VEGHHPPQHPDALASADEPRRRDLRNHGQRFYRLGRRPP
jgi:hypothetical protein